MKHRTIFVPMLMPKLSDQAATHLIDILEQLLGIDHEGVLLMVLLRIHPDGLPGGCL